MASPVASKLVLGDELDDFVIDDDDDDMAARLRRKSVSTGAPGKTGSLMKKQPKSPDSTE